MLNSNGRRILDQAFLVDRLIAAASLRSTTTQSCGPDVLLASATVACEFSIAVKNDANRERLRQFSSDIQSEGVARARRAILGIAA